MAGVAIDTVEDMKVNQSEENFFLFLNSLVLDSVRRNSAG